MTRNIICTAQTALNERIVTLVARREISRARAQVIPRLVRRQATTSRSATQIIFQTRGVHHTRLIDVDE